MKNRLYLNTFTSVIYQILSVVVGLIVPRLILVQYGSDINGLVSSITQLLSIISMLDLGVGAVIQSSFYKPLINKDWNTVSQIYSSGTIFFKKIAQILTIYIILLCLYFSYFKSEDYSSIFTITLILAISINFLAQYYFGICNTLLLNADQKIYLITIINIIGLILNFAITVLLLKLNSNIQTVKFASSLVYLLKPAALAYYVNRTYPLKKIRKPNANAIPEKWNGLAQHLASHLTNSLDNVLLTLFGNFLMISIYNVYTLPLISIKTFIEVISNSFKSYFGSLIAQNDSKLLSKFDLYEYTMHYSITIVMASCMILLVPFVMVYTKGVNDIQYQNNVFALFICLAYTAYALRIIYTNVIFASGKFKATQNYCILECVINLVISLILVKPLGIIGVAIGTLISSQYRLIISAYYLSKNVINLKFKNFLFLLLVDVLCFMLVILFWHFFEYRVSNFLNWFIYAVSVFAINVIICFIIYFTLLPKRTNDLLNYVFREFKGK